MVHFVFFIEWEIFPPHLPNIRIPLMEMSAIVKILGKFAKILIISNLFSKLKSKLQMRFQCWLKTIDFQVTRVANEVAYMVAPHFWKKVYNLGIFERNPKYYYCYYEVELDKVSNWFQSLALSNPGRGTEDTPPPPPKKKSHQTIFLFCNQWNIYKNILVPWQRYQVTRSVPKISPPLTK